MKKTIIALSLSAITLLAESSVIELAPLSVVATGIEESIIKQPVSIGTKGEKEIELDQVIFQKDLLNSLAGVHIEQTGSVIGHTTAIRMPENKSSYYLFMQDGIPVQSSGFFNHNGLAYTTFQSATSVEVLKGAGTALYGSDAVAAVINVKSLKKPSKDKEVSVKGMFGSDGFSSTSVEMSDTIDENSAYRANVSYMHSDGWRDNTSTDHFEANIRYDHIIDDENDLKIIFNTSVTDAQQADSFEDYENIENGSTKASDDAGYFTAMENVDVMRQFDYARLSVEWNNYSIDDVEMTFIPYIRYNRNQYVATWKTNYPVNDNELMTVGLLQKNTHDFSWGRLIGGFDAEYTQSSLNYTTSSQPTELLYNYDVAYMAIAPYIHAEYNIANNIMLTAGLRYDYNHYDYTNNLDQDSTDTSNTYYRRADRKDDFSHLSPKLSLSYQPTEDMNIYVRYANGFRIPQASRLYSMSVGYEEVTLDPENSNTYEIGVKKYFNEKSYTELTAYYMSVDDTIISYENIATGDNYYDNGGSTIHTGIEATVQVQATQEWAGHIAYSYSKHNYVDDATYENNEIAKAPNHLGNARLIYTPKYLKGLRVMAEYQYVGSYWMNDDHDKKYGGYMIGNIKADYTYSPSVRVFAKITNISDERYAVSASAGSWSDSYTPGDPRQFYGGLEYRW